MLDPKVLSGSLFSLLQELHLSQYEVRNRRKQYLDLDMLIVTPFWNENPLFQYYNPLRHALISPLSTNSALGPVSASLKNMDSPQNKSHA